MQQPMSAMSLEYSDARVYERPISRGELLASGVLHSQEEAPQQDGIYLEDAGYGEPYPCNSMDPGQAFPPNMQSYSDDFQAVLQHQQTLPPTSYAQQWEGEMMEGSPYDFHNMQAPPPQTYMMPEEVALVEQARNLVDERLYTPLEILQDWVVNPLASGVSDGLRAVFEGVAAIPEVSRPVVHELQVGADAILGGVKSAGEFVGVTMEVWHCRNCGATNSMKDAHCRMCGAGAEASGVEVPQESVFEEDLLPLQQQAAEEPFLQENAACFRTSGSLLPSQQIMPAAMPAYPSYSAVEERFVSPTLPPASVSSFQEPLPVSSYQEPLPVSAASIEVSSLPRPVRYAKVLSETEIKPQAALASAPRILQSSPAVAAPAVIAPTVPAAMAPTVVQSATILPTVPGTVPGTSIRPTVPGPSIQPASTMFSGASILPASRILSQQPISTSMALPVQPVQQVQPMASAPVLKTYHVESTNPLRMAAGATLPRLDVAGSDLRLAAVVG